jgi:putative nucleotidyltransferase with HDIG domain
MSSLALQPDMVHAKVRSLPALPQAVMELRAALKREDVAVDELARTISHDQALTAKTLRLANSSFYGVAGRVASIRDAINILGLRTVATVATTAMVISSFDRTACSGFDFDAFWRHAIATALCAQSLAQATRLDPEAAFTAGLLHDVGRLALATHFPLEMGQTLAWAARYDVFTLEAEQLMLGTDHTVVGGLIAGHWHFAPEIADAIQRHHAVPTQPRASLVDLIHVADNITHALDISALPEDMVPPLSLEAWQRLGLSATQIEDTLARTESQARQVCESLTV